MKEKLFIICALCLLHFGKVAKVEASGLQLEYKVKAAFLVNFARFISWPSETYLNESEPFNICIIGDDPIQKAFTGIENKKIQGRNIIIRKCNATKEVTFCQLLYISNSEKNLLKQYLNTTSNKPIVTVSGIENSVIYGGIIEFIAVNGRLSFKINHSKARATGLNVDASLLDLAAKVY